MVKLNIWIFILSIMLTLIVGVYIGKYIEKKNTEKVHFAWRKSNDKIAQAVERTNQLIDSMVQELRGNNEP